MSKILLVEDEPALAEIIKETLILKGFEVIHAQTASDTISKYHTNKPDILVLDVMLPDGDGFSIAKQIRQTDTQTPIIFLTSKSLPKDVVAGFESGGNDYLKKPFSIEELVIRIRALLSQNRLVLKPKEEEKHAIKNRPLSVSLSRGHFSFGRHSKGFNQSRSRNFTDALAKPKQYAGAEYHFKYLME